jgi:8-amino-7-oxononanoate synthase
MKLTQIMEKMLERRKEDNALRQLLPPSLLIDFFSNDYLGFSGSSEIFESSLDILKREGTLLNGATGSRLLSGNHLLFAEAEERIATFHESEAALIFNSGYDANVGLLSSVAQRGDIILFDELSHASIRDGITQSNSRAFKFRHNDIKQLTDLIEKFKNASPASEIFIVTESVFSMDGDMPDLESMEEVAALHNCKLIIDEAHATGVIGNNGRGLVHELGLQDRVFARILTFGKAMGAHGAAVLGSTELKEFLVNFSRSFIYTTGLPPHSVATIIAAYTNLQNHNNIKTLQENIRTFREEIKNNGLEEDFLESNSPIQSCIIPGNNKVKQIAAKFQAAGFEVKPILSPTVPVGRERLRFCLHSFNSGDEIKQVLQLLATFIK